MRTKMNKELFNLIKNNNVPNIHAKVSPINIALIWVVVLLVSFILIYMYRFGQKNYKAMLDQNKWSDYELKAYKRRLFPKSACIISILLTLIVASIMTTYDVIITARESHKEKQWTQALAKTDINKAVKTEIKNHPLIFNQKVLTSYLNAQSFQLNNLFNLENTNTLINTPKSQLSISNKQITFHLNINKNTSSFDSWSNADNPGRFNGGLAEINVDLIIDSNNNVKIQPNDITSLQISRIEAYIKANNLKLNDKTTEIKTTDSTTTVTSITSDQKIIKMKADSKVINIDIT